MIDIMVDRWFDLIDQSKIKTGKELRSLIDQYAKDWSRMKYDHQGEVSFLIGKRYNHK